jgi:hypothetical protein
MDRKLVKRSLIPIGLTQTETVDLVLVLLAMTLSPL